MSARRKERESGQSSEVVVVADEGRRRGEEVGSQGREGAGHRTPAKEADAAAAEGLEVM